MQCRNKLCPRFITTDDITFAAGVVTINIPAGTYNNRCPYCLVITDAIPDDATVGATVVVTIGTDTTTYPLLLCNGVQATVGSMALQSRRIYQTIFNTALGGGGNFRLTGRINCGFGEPVPASVTVAPAAEGGASA